MTQAKPEASSAPKVFKERRGPETLRLRAITPSLTVDDLKKSLAFYTDVLGFVVGEYWTDEGGQPRGAMLRAGACSLSLSQDDGRMGRDRTKADGMRLWCETAQDIDALAVRIKASGVKLTAEPKNERWGPRTLSLDDPNGYHLTIAQQD